MITAFNQPIPLYLSDLVSEQDQQIIKSATSKSIVENNTTPSPSYFSEGDILVVLNCDGCSINVRAPIDSYYSHILPYDEFRVDRVICLIFSQEFETSYYGYHVSYDTYKDPVDETLNIRWKQIGSNCSDGWCNPLAVLKFGIQEEKPYLFFTTDKKYKLNKGDEVIIVLLKEDSKQILKFSINTSSKKTCDNKYIAKAQIFDNDLMYLLQYDFEIVQFNFKDDRVEIRQGISPSVGDKDKEAKLKYLFKCYVSCFYNILIQNNITIPKFEKIQTSDNCINNLQINGCYVYLMVDTTNGFYKIGISNKPEYRERTLQSEKPTIEIVCAKHFPSRIIAEAIEFALHKAFCDKRIRGEWFDLNEQDVSDLKKTLS